MISSTTDGLLNVTCMVSLAVALLAFLDGRDWQLQLWAWSRTLAPVSPNAFIEDELEEPTDDELLAGPEVILHEQLKAAHDPLAAGALHAALARTYDGTSQPETAFYHYTMARDSAAVAAKTAPPPLRAGNGIVAVGKEREALAEAQLALARAYSKHGRVKEAEEVLQEVLSDPSFVGLETLQLAEVLRELGHMTRQLGEPKLALRYYTMARSRVENTAEDDVVAGEIFRGLLEDMAAIERLTQRRSTSVAPCRGSTMASSTSMQENTLSDPIKVAALSGLGTPLAARVEALLAAGKVEQAETDCVRAMRAVDNGAHGYSEQALARILLGSVYRSQGRLDDARRQFHGALTQALSTDGADSKAAKHAYDSLVHLQTLFITQDTPRGRLAAQAIFRDAQRAADDTGLPFFAARSEAEARLRVTAKLAEGRLDEARREFQGALTEALGKDGADSKAAGRAYDSLVHLQTLFIAQDTPRGRLAAQAIFRDAQRAAHDTGLPFSAARSEAEARLRATASSTGMQKNTLNGATAEAAPPHIGTPLAEGVEALLAAGKAEQAKGRLDEARWQFHGAPTESLGKDGADSKAAGRAYDSLVHLQTLFIAQDTPRGRLAAQAIFRDAQRAAHDAGLPFSAARSEAEARLRATAKLAYGR